MSPPAARLVAWLALAGAAGIALAPAGAQAPGQAAPLGLGRPIPAASGSEAAPRRSGYADMGATTQAMQSEDTANPGMLAVLEGDTLWRRPAGVAGKACVDCHGDPSRMTGVATRYPLFDAASAAPMSLDQRINACRVRAQQAPALAWESRELLALGALIGRQSRGLPIEDPSDPRLAPWRERGRLRYEQRIGQLNFSCRDCHDTLAGRRLGASMIPQGHATGYPIYRLEWQSMGSLQRRLRNCMNGVRAEPYAFGSIEHLELELHLRSRAAGMPLETPAVRP